MMEKLKAVLDSFFLIALIFKDRPLWTMEFLITGMNRKASFGNIPQQAALYYIPAYTG